MKSCPECGADVQDTHSFCPECATPMSGPARATARGQSSDDGSSTGGNGSDDSDGLSRRDLMIYGGAAVGTAAVGGGAGFLLLSGGGSQGPAAVAKTFIQRLNGGNTEGANAMLHGEAPTQEVSPIAANMFAQSDITIESTEVVDENSTHAQVTVELTATGSGTEGAQNTTVHLQKESGEWQVLRLR